MEYVLNAIGLESPSFRRFFSPLAGFGRHIHDHFIPHPRNNYHPHILGDRSLALMSSLLLAVRIFAIALISFGPVAPAFSSAITTTNIIALTNESRQQFAVPALTENQILDKAAQAKADDMLAKGYFAHNSPDGRTPWDFITSAGYSYLMAGENLAVNFTEAESVETAWMNSPGHKANILNKNFQDIGIGISQGVYQGHNAIFVVQEFGLSAAQQVALSAEPTQVQKTPVPVPTAPAVQPAATKPASQVKSASSPEVAAPQNNSTQAQALTGTQVQPPPPVAISDGNVQLVGNNIQINAQVTGPAVKVLAYFGQQAVMLSPKDQTTWSGQASASELATANTTVKLEAFGMQGQTNQLQLADFSLNTQTNYNLSGSTPTSYVTFMGQTFNPNVFESRFYLFFIAGLLSSLILAIAVKRHVQHLPLIANSSFVVIFAALLLWAG
jgi:Cysteine-rich secretory protein family